MKVNALNEISQILAAIIFGSTARGDSDTCSDFDIFILCEDIPFNEMKKIKGIVSILFKCHPSNVSVYRLRDVLTMAQKGSLFLWHLKLEGHIVFSRRSIIEQIFSSLRPYNNYKKDFVLYRSLLGDVQKSLNHWRQVNEFDLALLFTICRNTCMLLSFLKGIPKFGRESVFVVAKTAYDNQFSLNKDTYKKLLAWKLGYERGILGAEELPSYEEMTIIIRQANQLINLGLRSCL